MTLLVRRRYFRAEGDAVTGAAILVVAAAIFVWLSTTAVTARLEAIRARQAECAAKVEALRARNPWLVRGHVRRAEPCLDLAVLTGQPR